MTLHRSFSMPFSSQSVNNFPFPLSFLYVTGRVDGTSRYDVSPNEFLGPMVLKMNGPRTNNVTALIHLCHYAFYDTYRLMHNDRDVSIQSRVPNFEQKNYSAKDGTRRNGPLFRRNSACFAKQKTFGIPFRVVPRMRSRRGQEG